MARYVMVIDSEKCMDCKACVIACQQRNHVPYGLSRNWVRETNSENSPCGFKFQPGACMHCDDPSCVRACPTGATWKAKDGTVEIDRSRCIGCGSCIEACPYHARFRHPVTGTADKCDYCHGSTPGQIPACVAVCPMHCRIFGDADDPSSDVAKVLATRKAVHVIPLGSGAKPTLTYLDSTTPEQLPEASTVSHPVGAIPPLAKGVTWVGDLVLAALTGTFVRQLVKSSEKEDAEIAAEKKLAASDDDKHDKEDNA